MLPRSLSAACQSFCSKPKFAPLFFFSFCFFRPATGTHLSPAKTPRKQLRNYKTSEPLSTIENWPFPKSQLPLNSPQPIQNFELKIILDIEYQYAIIGWLSRRFIFPGSCTMPARHAVLLTPSKSSAPTQLLSCKQIAPVTTF